MSNGQKRPPRRATVDPPLGKVRDVVVGPRRTDLAAAMGASVGTAKVPVNCPARSLTRVARYLNLAWVTSAGR
jgi:hypothetical protein